MTSFGWKRKLGANVSKEVAEKFSADELSSANDKVTSEATDWLNSFKRRKASLQSSCELKSKQLKDEGVTLAENGRYHEAVEKWEKAINLTPSDAKLHEMKSQALLQLNESFLAVRAAEVSIQIDPKWWIAYQTLGRAQLGMGEIEMAIVSFSKALHINPAAEELWEKDLKWSLNILEEKGKLNEIPKTPQEKAEEEASKMVFDEDGFIKEFAGRDSDLQNKLVQCRF